ncbi:MAG TPA: chemotaxis-specific protein-glutamate methyltransferase CheB [Kofleriaceae bacterium]
MTTIRVLIAEDSDAMRNTLETLLGLDPRIEVIGTARDGIEAVELAKSLRPDLITMDVQMPRLDGVEATARIMSECPARILMVSAYADDSQIDLSFRAIAAGALEVVAKPASANANELRAWARYVCDTIVLMAEVPIITRSRRSRTTLTEPRVDIVAIAASTGGPLALAKLLAALPPDLPVPILVAQHIAEGFTEGMVRWLGKITKLSVRVAEDGTPVAPAHVYFPPDGHDLEITEGQILRTPAACERYAPSGDLLLSAVARHYRTRALGIVLTGMGEDGALGLRALRDAGGITLAQSQESCVVFGMPQAAVKAGGTTDLRSIEGLVAGILEYTRRGLV